MNTRQEILQSKKPSRVPISERNALSVSGKLDTENFYHRWFNDVNDRIQDALNAGYEFVNKTGLGVGDKTVESARGTDSLLTKGMGRGVVGYLMRLPIEFHKEDNRRKMKSVDATEETIKRANKENGRYGGIETEQKTTA